MRLQNFARLPGFSMTGECTITRDEHGVQVITVHEEQNPAVYCKCVFTDEAFDGNALRYKLVDEHGSLQALELIDAPITDLTGVPLTYVLELTNCKRLKSLKGLSSYGLNLYNCGPDVLSGLSRHCTNTFDLVIDYSPAELRKLEHLLELFRVKLDNITVHTAQATAPEAIALQNLLDNVQHLDVQNRDFIAIQEELIELGLNP